MYVIGDIISYLLVPLITGWGILAVGRIGRARLLGLSSILVAAGLELSVISGVWPLPSFTYALTWGIDFWYKAPPWTSLHVIWSFFGPMVYGDRLNQWLGYVLTCVFYALPYLLIFLLLRWALKRINSRLPGPIVMALNAISLASLAVWILLTLTGITAGIGRGIALFLP